MSRKLASDEYSKPEFDLGDFVSFTHNKWDADKEDETLYGRIVRVYGSRENYHVEVDGERYSVHVDEDMKKEFQVQYVLDKLGEECARLLTTVSDKLTQSELSEFITQIVKICK